MNMGRLALMIGAWALLGCTVEAPPAREPDFELETERMTILGFGRSEQELCAGTERWIDDYVDALAPDYDLDPGPIGEYRWYSDELWAELTPCGSANGCAHPVGGQPTAQAAIIPFEHEIAHVVNRARFDPCIAILEEGLAEHLRGTALVIEGGVEDVDIEHSLAASLEGGEWGSSDYHRSRHFVSFLEYEYGLESIVSLCERAPKGIAREEFDAVTRDVLGVGLDQLLVDYASYPVCSEEHDRAKLLECGREPTVELLAGQDGVIEFDASCGHPDAVGPKAGYFHISHTIRLLEDGEFSMSASAEGPPFALTGVVQRFEQCASCGEGATGYVRLWDSDYVDFGEWTEAGDYVLELQFPMDFSGTVAVNLYR